MDFLYGIVSLVQIVLGSGSLIALLNDSIQIAIGLMLILYLVSFLKSAISKNCKAIV